jgi:hypothetical protein
MGIAQILGTPISIGQYDSTRGPNFAIAKARIVLGTTGANGNVYSAGNFTPNPNFNPTLPSGATVMWQLESQFPDPTYPSIQDVTLLPQQLSSYGAVPTPIGGVTSNVLGPYPSTYPQLDSIRFDGTGYIDYGNAAASVLTTNIWANAWTIEAWVYPTSLPCQLFERSNLASGFDFSSNVNASGQVNFYYGASTVGPTLATVPVNTWTHIAVTYDSTRSNIYVSSNIIGTANISTTTSGSLAYVPSYGFHTGYNSVAGNYLNGNLADLRVSNAAIYTGSNYTVPSAPLPVLPSTMLLLRSLSGQTGTTLGVQGRGLKAVSLGATRSVQSYPPAPMSSYLLDTTSNASVTYGQGKYVASASSEYTTGSNWAWTAFDNIATTTWQSPYNTYSSSSPYGYIGSVTTVDNLGNSYPGEWVQLQMPVSVLLSSYSVQGYTSPYGPASWVLVGSRDGINWTFVDRRTGITWSGSLPVTVQTFVTSATQAYNYYRYIILTTVGNSQPYSPPVATISFNGTEEALCITSDSKVGVGIANPQRALEVAGDLVVSGTISGGAGMGAFRNRIINGDMRIAQRGTSSTVVGYGCVDRWSIASSLVATVTQSQQTLVASDTPYQLGFRNSWRITANTGISVSTWFSTTPYAYPTHNIEAYNISDFNWGTAFGSPVTLSFWIRSNIPSGSETGFVFRNVAAGGSHWTINQPFTYNNTGTWQYVASTVQPPPNGSGWNTGTNTGIELFICPVYTQKSSNVAIWQNVNNVGLPGSYIWPQTAGNYIEFTGVQLEKGTVATPFEFRPYATELALCQRYYYRTPDVQNSKTLVGMVESATSSNITMALPVQMRANPTVSFASGARHYSIGSGLSAVAPIITSQQSSPGNASIQVNITGGVAGQVGFITNTGTPGYTEFNSEI